MALTLAEGLVNALTTYISDANLTAKLAALDAAYADGISLVPPVARYVGLKSLDGIPDYPALYIFSSTTGFIPRSVDSGDSKPTVHLGIVATDMDSEVLQRRVYRYGRALVELILEGMTPPNQLGGWTPASEEWLLDYSTAEFTQSKDSDWVGEVTLTVRADDWEAK